MRIAILIAVVLLVPEVAFAGEVIVVPAAFMVEETQEEEGSPDAAEQITARVVAGVEDAEQTPVSGTEVAQAAAKAAGNDGPCRDRECLAALAEELGADEAVFVRVTELSVMERRVDVVLAHGEPVSETREDGFMVVLENVRRLVALSVKKSIAARKAASAVVEPEPEPETPPEPKSEPETEPRPEPRKADEGLPPTAFYVSAGLTSALAVSWVVTESVGYARQKDLDGRPSGDSDWDSLERLQIADRVLLGLTAAGAVTTAVLFFLTDFDAERPAPESAETTTRFRLAPTPGYNGGMVTFAGSFQ